VQDALTMINRRETPQTEQVRPDQVKNSAGGYVFQTDDWSRALRFLILGTDGGAYYVSQQDLTMDNARVIIGLAATDGVKLVELIRDVSLGGRAPRQNPTLFALAVCCASPDLETRQAAVASIQDVCRTGTHLFIFARYVEQFRGWGRALRRAIGDWYLRDIDTVSYQAVKYRQREGWSHRDLLRLSHPEASSQGQRDLFNWIVRGELSDSLPPVVKGYELAQRSSGATAKTWGEMVTEYPLMWEALPDEALKYPETWEALLPHMGLTALIRNLARFTQLGLIAPLGGRTNEIVSKLTDAVALKKARVHPLAVLVAAATYSSGHGFKGSQTWTPVPKIIEALNEAFYLAFGSIEPAGKRTLLGLDVSGSMTMGTVANSPLMPFQAEAAMAMVAMRTEPEVFPMAFSNGFVNLPLTASQRLDDVLRLMSGMPFSRTDCAVPMQWAAQNKVPVDTFIIYTDNETWSGGVHPFQALRRYRDIMGIPSKLVVVGMTATEFSIADPSDQGMLDVVGFDTAAPNLISAFSRGDL
jgi:60 kDa SS-A/Ro ribonucleoprotein